MSDIPDYVQFVKFDGGFCCFKVGDAPSGAGETPEIAWEDYADHAREDSNPVYSYSDDWWYCSDSNTAGKGATHQEALAAYHETCDTKHQAALLKARDVVKVHESLAESARADLARLEANDG